MNINAYVWNLEKWNLEKWHRQTYFQGRNRDADTENGRVDAEGESRDGTRGSGIDINTLPRVR